MTWKKIFSTESLWHRLSESFYRCANYGIGRTFADDIKKSGVAIWPLFRFGLLSGSYFSAGVKSPPHYSAPKGSFLHYLQKQDDKNVFKEVFVRKDWLCFQHLHAHRMSWFWSSFWWLIKKALSLTKAQWLGSQLRCDADLGSNLPHRDWKVDVDFNLR